MNSDHNLELTLTHGCQCLRQTLTRACAKTFASRRAVDKFVAQTSKSAVSQVSQPADRPNLLARPHVARPADLSVSVLLRRDRAEAKGEGGEVGDTAGLETCATMELADFVNSPFALRQAPATPAAALFQLFLALVFLPFVGRAEGVAGRSVTQSDPVITERGGDFRVWQRVTETQEGGRTNRQVESYKELITGLHYFSESGWTESKDSIVVLPSGYGAATQAVHRCLFSPSVTDYPATDYSGPQGERLQARIFGIVLNNVDLRREGYDEYYYYSYYTSDSA